MTREGAHETCENDIIDRVFAMAMLTQVTRIVASGLMGVGFVAILKESLECPSNNQYGWTCTLLLQARCPCTRAARGRGYKGSWVRHDTRWVFGSPRPAHEGELMNISRFAGIIRSLRTLMTSGAANSRAVRRDPHQRVCPAPPIGGGSRERERERERGGRERKRREREEEGEKGRGEEKGEKGRGGRMHGQRDGEEKRER
jgi:hypothetical protein